MSSFGNILVTQFWRILKFAVALTIVTALVLVTWLAPVTVRDHELATGELVAQIMGTGTLEARTKTTISSEIAGRIAEVLVDQGDRVKQGQLLVRLDDDELRQQVAIAQANLEVSQAGILRLTTDKDRAVAVADQARSHHRRIQSLISGNTVTQEEYDRAIEALAIADAGLSRAEAAIAEGQQELVAAEETLEYHRTRLTDTGLRAPFDGLIVQQKRDQGDIVVPGSAILTLISTDELWISAWVDETEMGKLEHGQPAQVIFRSEAQNFYPGVVTRLGREADRETREFVVDVQVLELPRNWAIGQRAEVFIATEKRDSAVLLPPEFVIPRNGQPGVFVDQGGRAEWQPLTLGLRSSSRVEVLEGPKAGETVVVPSDRQFQLHDGQRITRK